jgi:hypothetical protein
METITPPTPVKKRVNKPSKYIPRPSTRALARKLLQDLVLQKSYSITAAADSLDIEETLANSILFNKKPTQEQIDYALEIYNKGLPLLHACVASGVAMEVFKKAYRATKVDRYRSQR